MELRQLIPLTSIQSFFSLFSARPQFCCFLSLLKSQRCFHAYAFVAGKPTGATSQLYMNDTFVTAATSQSYVNDISVTVATSQSYVNDTSVTAFGSAGDEGVVELGYLFFPSLNVKYLIYILMHTTACIEICFSAVSTVDAVYLSDFCKGKTISVI